MAARYSRLQLTDGSFLLLTDGTSYLLLSGPEEIPVGVYGISDAGLADVRLSEALLADESIDDVI